MDNRAKTLRQNATEAERKLWTALRNRQIGKAKFRRQQRLGPYVVDFICFDVGRIVELDGGQHAPEIDRPRTAWLESRGYRVLRFWNNEVSDNMAGVLAAIESAVAAPSPGC